MRSERTHVLLDLDGTLSDSEPGILRSLQWAFDKEGFPIPTKEQVRSVIGPPFEIGLPQIGIPENDLERVIDRYRERYATIGAFENTLYPGIVEMLDALSRDGLSLSVATAKPEVTAHPILDYFDISDRFAVRAGATLTPDRRAKADVVARHGCDRDRCRGAGSGGRIERNLGDTASDDVGSDRWRAVDLRNRCGRKRIRTRRGRGRHGAVRDGRGDQRRRSRAVTTRSSEDRRHHDGGRKPTFHQS